MYNYENITALHLEVTSKCQARCPMCPRRLNGGPMLENLNLEEIYLETFKKWFNEDFIKQLNHISLCGNLGDPIVAQDTLEILEYARSLNKNVELRMHTNGSGRKKSWWQKLAHYNVEVIFGIDGLEDTHALYRINTDWHKIIENAKSFIGAGGNARWDMLVFKHNEHQVAACRRMSQQLGFTDFTEKNTSRFKNNEFHVIDDNFNITHTIHPSVKSEKMIPLVEEAKKDTLSQIKCKAKEASMIYVSAKGNVSPCCWLDIDWLPQHSESKLDYMIKIKEIPNLYNTSLREIFNSKHFDKIQSTWNSCGLKECSKQCGSFDKLGAQFGES